MCGICGQVNLDEGHHVEREKLLRMASALLHRGPDGEGVWNSRHVGLAHRRLAIIDLRALADQPMTNEDGSIWLVFNGEIYNFRELRSELELKGHVFRTNSDTEVIIHAYEAYGKDSLSRLRGMFAFALWDERKQTLLLARDRVGKKPLFYFHANDRFLFASEIKAILSDPSVPRQVNPIAMDHFLALQYIPSPLTAFQGIKKLPAAHWLELHRGQVTTGRYWQLDYTPKRQITMQDALVELRWHFAEAVRLRLISDVPIGAFLSGGVDSSAVVAFMAQEMSTPVKTFAVGFEEASFDERSFARQVAQRYSTDHTELIVKAPVQDILPRLLWHYDEPFGDPSAVPSYEIASLTRQHVTVVLNGDGGDENFAGYDWYARDRFFQSMEIIPLAARQWLGKFARYWPQAWRHSPLLRKLPRALELCSLPSAYRYAQWLGHFALETRRDFYQESFREHLIGSYPEKLFDPYLTSHTSLDWLDKMLNTDVNTYLADDLLVKMDRASMAHSLEARSPFLDHVFMEFVASLPSSMKLKGFETKFLLKKALRDFLPETILYRPKQGFSVPLAQWFHTDLREMAYDTLLAPRALQRNYFKPQVLETLLREHTSHIKDHSKELWDLLVLELWHRVFIDQEACL